MSNWPMKPFALVKLPAANRKLTHSLFFFQSFPLPIPIPIPTDTSMYMLLLIRPRS